jgi:hypothetical protein
MFKIKGNEIFDARHFTVIKTKSPAGNLWKFAQYADKSLDLSASFSIP